MDNYELQKEAFVGALVGGAARLLPKVLKAGKSVAKSVSPTSVARGAGTTARAVSSGIKAEVKNVKTLGSNVAAGTKAVGRGVKNYGTSLKRAFKGQPLKTPTPKAPFDPLKASREAAKARQAGKIAARANARKFVSPSQAVANAQKMGKAKHITAAAKPTTGPRTLAGKPKGFDAVKANARETWQKMGPVGKTVATAAAIPVAANAIGSLRRPAAPAPVVVKTGSAQNGVARLRQSFINKLAARVPNYGARQPVLDADASTPSNHSQSS